MLGTGTDPNLWEIDSDADLPPSGVSDGYLDESLAAQLAALDLTLDTWCQELSYELDSCTLSHADATRTGDHTSELAEVLRMQYLFGVQSTLGLLSEVVAYLTEDDNKLGSLSLKRSMSEKEQLRQHAVRLVARLNDAVLQRQAHRNTHPTPRS